MIECNRLGVIVINYKTPQLTIDCIRSLQDQLQPAEDHIVIVDNDSGGDDVAAIMNAIKEPGLADLVSLVSAPANNGFSSGNNIGVKTLQAKYYLLANADTVFRPQSVANLIHAAEKYPDAGIVSPRLEWPDGEPQISCFRFHSPLSELINAAGTGPITRLLNKFDVPLKTIDQATTPEWTSFACVLIRQEVFAKAGLLDDGYFMYYEDVDYCRRARQAGYTILNWPFAHVVHLRGQSSDVKARQRGKKRLPGFYYRSRSRYYRKFYGRCGFLAANTCWLVGRTISLLREGLFGKSRTVPEYQHLDIWKR